MHRSGPLAVEMIARMQLISFAFWARSLYPVLLGLGGREMFLRHVNKWALALKTAGCFCGKKPEYEHEQAKMILIVTRVLLPMKF